MDEDIDTGDLKYGELGTVDGAEVNILGANFDKNIKDPLLIKNLRNEYLDFINNFNH